jgi:putative NIF3 family GTP cyclohydrolase 1 type 2/GNAT superfamily N-acetyltransferase
MTITARQVHEHLRAVGPWAAWDAGTCDGFKHGDPDTPVQGIAVGWQSLQSALQEAHAKGCNLFITHEPTFYSHMDDDPVAHETVAAARKRAFLDRAGMVVYRCHDVWDAFPRLGILDSWAAFLELGEPVARLPFHSLHQVPSTSAWELVRRIAERVKSLDEQSVQFIGHKWQMVSRLAIGTGAITRVREMVDMGADIVLATDDGVSLWRDGAWMADMGVPLIMVNHMTAEIPGVRNLAAYLTQEFPGLPVEFVGPPALTRSWLPSPRATPASACGWTVWTACHRWRFRRGTALRPMAADEIWAYLEVMNRSNFAGEAGEAWFQRTFSQDPEYDPSYLQIVWKGKQPVAAAAAWHREVDGEKWGMVHWVGALDSERGKGLGKAVTLGVLHRLRERGFRRAMLSTGTWRLAAVAAYLRLGFVPWPSEDAPQALWDRVLADLEEWRRAGRQGR